MTCDPDLVASPLALLDPENEGEVLQWTCCGRTWYLSPTPLPDNERSYKALHVAASVLSPLP